MGYVYIIKCCESDKAYVGKTAYTLELRMYQHKQSARKGRKSSLYNAMRKYGAETFSIEALFQTNDIDELTRKEVEFIKQFRSYELGWNMTPGGDGWSKGMHMSEETKSRISVTLSGVGHSPERRKAIGNGKRQGTSSRKVICPRCGAFIVDYLMSKHLDSERCKYWVTHKDSRDKYAKPSI